MQTLKISYLQLLSYTLGILMLAACGRPVSTPNGGLGIPIKLANADYPLDIFYENQPTNRPYTQLGPVKVEKSVPLSEAQTKEGRMIYRGNDESQKRALLDQLILQGVGMGAHALVNVRYQYYTTKDYQGFVMEGIAVKYGNMPSPR
ncbi:hypothetical protein [Runella zeae]|jgi:hypothetical protein|uniref:hypothetical protein n=1 Tax=Runella zeae TaxID=94255 RepID=UPI00056CDE26|nr:hypothetical protein [Runella zeae]